MNDVAKTHIIELDDLCLLMLKHLNAHNNEEPAVPDNGRYEHEEAAAAHYEWSRAHQAIRLMLGIQLVKLATEQQGTTREERA